MCQKMMSAWLIGTFLVFQMVSLSSLQPLNSTFPCHVRFSSNFQHIIVAKYDMIISFDDLARQFSEHFPKPFVGQRGTFLFPFSGSD